jgi:TolB-like protein
MEKIAIQIPPEQVHQQLQRLLRQEEFKRSPILAKFLELVVLSKLASREDEIKEYTIAVKALGRSVDFNPQFDAVVRIHARRLRNILFEYYHGNGSEDPVIITIPKGSYVPVFDLNKEKNEKLKPDTFSSTEINGHEGTRPIQKRRSITPVLAVLPFHDLSAERSNDDFLGAFCEQLSTELSRFDNLSVMSYYATRKLDADVKDLARLRSEGIDFILTGSLRLHNGTLRLNIQLMTVDSANILWSDSLLRHELTDTNAFDIQDEIISQITNAIADDPKTISTLNKSRQAENPEERSLVLKAISEYFEYSYDYDSDKFGPTLQAMENAYRVDPENALVLSMLSKLYLDQYACAVEQDKDLLEKGIELAKRAIWLDQRSQRAQKALAWGLILSGNKGKGKEVLDQCLSINPTASSSLSTLGLGLIMLGEYENGYSMIRQSLKLKQNQNASACAKLGFSLYYFQNKNYDECSRWLKLLPPFDTPFANLLNIAVDGNLNGKTDQTVNSMQDIKGHETNIVGRIVQDPKLRTNIMKGWKLAGYSPKEVN